MNLAAIYLRNYLSKPFSSPLNLVLTTISLASALNMFFFIERKSVLPQFIIFETTSIHYLIMIVLLVLLGRISAKKQVSNTLAFKQWLKTMAIVLLPTQIALFAGLFIFNEQTHANIIFYLSAFAYPAAIAIALIWRRNSYDTGKTGPANILKKIFNKKNLAFTLPLVAIVAVHLFFATKNIGNFAAVDEPLWTFDRIPGYWKNVLEGDFDNTAISDKPGITVALISGIGLLDVNPKTYDSGNSQKSAPNITEMNTAFRLPLAIFTSLSLFVFYFLLNSLFEEKIALLSTAAIAFSPPLLGMSRIINPDALLWVFAPLSILSYLAFLQKRQRAYLLAAGLLLGFSLLNKYVANFVTVFIVFISFCEIFLTKKPKDTSSETRIRHALADIASVVTISLVTFYVFYPATWLAPEKLLSATLASQAFISTAPYFVLILITILFDTFILRSLVMKKLSDFLSKRIRVVFLSASLIFIALVSFVFSNVYLAMSPFDFQEILSSPKTSFTSTAFWGLFSANFYPLIFTTVPLLLFGAIFALLQPFRKNKCADSVRNFVFYCISFIMLYYLATTINGVASTIRYQIMLFPFFLILGSVGLAAIITKIRTKYAYPAALAIIIFSLISTMLTASPHYLAYASSLLPNKYIVDVKDMGDGSYEAAQFLNSLPDAEKLFVWSDKKGVCNFFIGRCDSFTGSEEFNAVTIDYFVISSGRKSRSLNMLSSRASNPYDFPKIYNSTDFIHQLIIGNRPANYIRILEAKNYLKQ